MEIPKEAISPEGDAFQVKLREALVENYREMQGLSMNLEADPLKVGLSDLHQKIAKARALVNKVCNILSDLLETRAHLTSRVKIAKTFYEQRYNDIRRSGASGQDASARDADCKARAAQEQLEWSYWEVLLAEVDGCRSVAQLRYENLNNTLADLQKQQNTIRMQLTIGELATPPAPGIEINRSTLEI